MKKNLVISLLASLVGATYLSGEVSAQSYVTTRSQKKIAASNVTYSNKTSKLKAKTAQGAIDEIGIDVAGAIAGRGKTGIRALATTSWRGFQYFYAGGIEGKEGPAETLQKAVVTMTFTPSTERTGTLTITPINFVCDTQTEFTQNGTGVCGNYGDTFTYGYTILGANLFVEDGRASDGRLIGQGTMDAAGTGAHLDIQNQGASNLVLKYRDLVTSVFDLTRSN
jgi:hypothetical protein